MGGRRAVNDGVWLYVFRLRFFFGGGDVPFGQWYGMYVHVRIDMENWSNLVPYILLVM